MATERTNHQAVAVAAILDLLGPVDGDLYMRQSDDNKIALPGADLPRRQWFEHGDLRIETVRATVTVEVESAGGLTNLVKYRPGPTAIPGNTDNHGTFLRRLRPRHA